MDEREIQRQVKVRGGILKKLKFSEDGYELLIGLKNPDIGSCDVNRWKEIEKFNIEGIRIAESEYREDDLKLLLIPICGEEFNDFVLRYVEQYRHQYRSEIAAFWNAITALETLIENQYDKVLDEKLKKYLTETVQ